MGRAPCCDKSTVKRGPWSPEEDAKLKTHIHQYGTGGNWIALPQKIGLKRCGKSCRLRWLNYLRPNLKHGSFSEQEDNIICSLYLNIGSRWSIIAAQLPGRTDNDIKNYWNTKLKKKLEEKQRKEAQASLKQEMKIESESLVGVISQIDPYWPTQQHSLSIPVANEHTSIIQHYNLTNQTSSLEGGVKFSEDHQQPYTMITSTTAMENGIFQGFGNFPQCVNYQQQIEDGSMQVFYDSTNTALTESNSWGWGDINSPLFYDYEGGQQRMAMPQSVTFEECRNFQMRAK